MTSGVPRLFLIDGYALIYRAFYAMIGRPLTTSRGENTSITWGVANFLLRLFREHTPEYVAWVHDAGTSFRHEIFPDYKATRERLEPDQQAVFDRSVERVTQLLDALHIALVAVDGYEADDVIGTLAARATEQDLHAVIVSADKDFYQLLSEQVSLLNPGRGGAAAVDEHWVDVTNAAERLGVPPERVVDYLALLGDASDNVPGVRGVGAKYAGELIAQYGDLDSILAHAPEVNRKRVREALLAHGDSARLSRDLVTIHRDVPVGLDLDAFAVQSPKRDALVSLFTELEFHSLIPQIRGPEADAANAAVTVVADAAGVRAAVDAVRRAGPVAVVVLARGGIVGLALGVEDGRGWYFPLGHEAPRELGAEEPANLPPLSDTVTQSLAELLADAAVPKIGHDIKYDWLALERAGVVLRGIDYDTALASFLLDPGRRSQDLEVVALDRVGVRIAARSDLVGKGKNARPLAEIPPGAAADFACGRAHVVHRLRSVFTPELQHTGLRRLLREVELPLVPVLVAMEARGIAVDVARLAELSREFGASLRALERQIYDDAGTDFNINSTPQLRHVLFEKLQLPVIKRTKTGPSTDADVLAQLAEMGFTTPGLLLEYRELAKLRSTYVDALPGYVDATSGRIHTTFHQTGAATGRLSSSDPNLQNIPVRTKRGEEIRRCFVPAAGSRLIVADYSQIELRVLAHLSEDEAFTAAFARGGDIHRETAAVIFAVAPEDVSAEMRAQAKTINFATIYGQGPFSLSKQLGITQDDARAFIETYFERFAGVRRFLDATIAHARERGYVETILGRRRYIPELQDRNRSVRAFGERTAMNSPMQGSAADLIKVAMVRVARSLAADGRRTALLLQVHDELVLEGPADEVAAVAEMVRREMEGAASLRVPLVAQVGIGENWVDAKA